MGSWPPRVGCEWWGQGTRPPHPSRPGAEGLTSGQGGGWGRYLWGDAEPSDHAQPCSDIGPRVPGAAARGAPGSRAAPEPVC